MSRTAEMDVKVEGATLVDVAAALEARTEGDAMAVFLTLGGKVLGTDEEAEHKFLMTPEGAAALIVRLIDVAVKSSDEMALRFHEEMKRIQAEAGGEPDAPID